MRPDELMSVMLGERSTGEKAACSECGGVHPVVVCGLESSGEPARRVMCPRCGRVKPGYVEQKPIERPW